MKKQFLSFLLLISFLILFSFSAFAQTREARKFDEFGEIPCEELRARLDNLGTQLRSENYSIALIYVYEGKHSIPVWNENYVLPRFGESVARTQTMQMRLSFLRYNPKNFIFADGGFRERFWVEFWIVPKGAKLPKATPTLETMKYQKGTPTDICREV
jgi:hypothetical protein